MSSSIVVGKHFQIALLLCTSLTGFTGLNTFAAETVKIAKIYAENEKYILFTSYKKGTTYFDRKLWVKDKASGQIRLTNDFKDFGISRIVFGAVLAQKTPIAYALVLVNIKPSFGDDIVVEVDLKSGKTRKIFSANNLYIDLGLGLPLIISPDDRFLAVDAGYLARRADGSRFRDEALFRFGPLDSSQPKLERVLINSKKWPCTDAQLVVIPCK
jgi:hypothetical protein